MHINGFKCMLEDFVIHVKYHHFVIHVIYNYLVDLHCYDTVHVHTFRANLKKV